MNHYLIIFGFQRRMNLPQYSHTFATFLECENDQPTNSLTISWMPEVFHFRLLWASEVGRNYSLKKTLDIALRARAKIAQWGPFAIRAELYQRALEQVAYLHKNRVRYKALDLGLRPTRATNCIHALCDLDRHHQKKLISGIRYGFSASRKVAQYFSRYYLQAQNHSLNTT